MCIAPLVQHENNPQNIAVMSYDKARRRSSDEQHAVSFHAAITTTQFAHSPCSIGVGMERVMLMKDWEEVSRYCCIPIRSVVLGTAGT
jgi:hypothetical protein